jgi:hypothetical protein
LPYTKTRAAKRTGVVQPFVGSDERLLLASDRDWRPSSSDRIHHALVPIGRPADERLALALVSPNHAFTGNERLEELGGAAHAIVEALGARDDELALDDLVPVPV